MDINFINDVVITNAFKLLPVKMRGDDARLMLLAIGQQESGYETRMQKNGPAIGFWQFERAGVYGLIKHSAVSDVLADLCLFYCVPMNSHEIHDSLRNDMFAAMISRLLLYTLPRALPRIGDIDEAWEQYIEAWRPGKPSRERWDESYPMAMRTMNLHGV